MQGKGTEGENDIGEKKMKSNGWGRNELQKGGKNRDKKKKEMAIGGILNDMSSV